ncbi:hypothetical protein AMATHDRAFT_146458, partial [Amanita thiersii Skay4041]
TLNPYESRFGYSRAVRKGPFIFISGTTSIDPATQTLLHPTSAYLQATQVFAEIIRAVEALQGTKKDIMRVRMFVARHEDCEDVGRALRDTFVGGGGGEGDEDGNGNGDAEGPAATMIVGVGFVDPAMKVEIEADAVVM